MFRSAGLYLNQVNHEASTRSSWFLCVKHVLEQFLDQIHMCHDHTAAAVTLASKLVHRVSAQASQRTATTSDPT